MMKRNLPGQKRRGYTIIEMAIAVTVLTILLGGALIPVSRQYEKRQYDQTRGLIAEARGAVVSYALRNRTGARGIVYYDNLPYAIPGGRPYLPCPDITGDGIEDRAGIRPLAGGVLPAAALASDGVCASQKGALPWKTLGLKREVDTWGNRLTYHVDAAYSNALLGFDETSRADFHDTRLQLVSGAFVARDRRLQPAIVTECTAPPPTTPGAFCPGPVVGGVVFPSFTGRIGPFDYNLGSVVEGVVFIVLSHGRNGDYAINVSGRCNSGRSSGPNLDLKNAIYPVAITQLPDCPHSTSAGWSSYHSSPPVTSGDVNHSDDIIDWMMADELFGMLMESGALPLTKLQFLPVTSR